jgi:polyphenol oxidase
MPPQPSDQFAWVQAAVGPALVCGPLHAVARHIFTTRAWRLGSVATESRENGWSEVSAAMAVGPLNLVRVHQVHGAAIVVARSGDGAIRPPADIMITSDAAAALAVQAADCVPLLIADRRTGVVAAAHAGWRGLAARVPQVAVQALTREFGSVPADMVVAVGPSIGACCYEVGVDVRDAFARAGYRDADLARWFFEHPQPTAANASMPTLSNTRRADHWFMDAWRIARHQLELAGVPFDQIHVAALCTASHPDMLCSYRRDGTGAGRIAGAIAAPGRPRTK